jgi:type II secretory pathway component GspD/PulD (secretin)
VKRFISGLLAFLLATLGPASAGAPLLDIDVHDAQLGDVLALLAAQSGRNIVADGSIKPQRVTLHLHQVSFQAALSVLAESQNLQIHRDGDILVVGASEQMNRRYAADGDADAAQTIALPLQHASPDDVSKELTEALTPGTVILADRRTSSIIVSGGRETIDRARALVQILDAAQTGRGLREVAHVYRFRFLRPSQAVLALKGALPDGSYIADDAQNAIVVTGDAGAQRVASQFVKSLDVPSPQVLFEVRVADIEPRNDQSDIGIQFGGYDLTGQPISGAATYAFARNSLAINARLNALVSTGHAEILATPKLVTLNNKEADLLIGETYPVVYYDARMGGQQVQFVDIGVKLRLTPTIGADGSVTAELHPEYSAIESFVGGYPVLANRKIDSTLRVKDDQTIVLGGLIRDVDSETLSKLPGLSSIPILGKLFENRQSTRQRDEVVFLITPHVLYPNDPPPTR